MTYYGATCTTHELTAGQANDTYTARYLGAGGWAISSYGARSPIPESDLRRTTQYSSYTARAPHRTACDHYPGSFFYLRVVQSPVGEECRECGVRD